MAGRQHEGQGCWSVLRGNSMTPLSARENNSNSGDHDEDDNDGDDAGGGDDGGGNADRQ